MSRVIVPSKKAAETRTYTFDFISSLAPGETITSAAATVTPYSGTDTLNGASAMLSGAASIINGRYIKQAIVGGFPGNIYLLAAFATCSNGAVYQISALLAILP